MNTKYEALAKVLQDKNPEFLRQDSEQNVDQLIVKPNVFAYVPREHIERIEKEGIMTPAAMLKQYPDYRDQIMKHFGHQLHDQKLANCVTAFLCRVPTILDNTQEFNQKYAAVKIVIDKLKKSNDKFKVYMINHPFRKNEMVELTPEQLPKLTQKESKWFQFFKKSDHPTFADVPQIAICCQGGKVPAFAMKVIKDSSKKPV